MALSRLSILVVIATIILPSIAMAKEFVVGDDHGWTAAFDYKAWAADKIFRVGDILIFKYAIGEDNVFKVNGTSFQSCMVPPESEALSTGSDTVVLATPGRQWYISGVHCNAGQKLVITAQPDTPPPSLPPASSPLPPASSHVQHVPHFGRWMRKNLLKGFR